MPILDPSQSLFNLPPELLTQLQGMGAPAGGLMQSLSRLGDPGRGVIPQTGVVPGSAPPTPGVVPSAQPAPQPSGAQAPDPNDPLDGNPPPSQAFQNALLAGGAAAASAPVYNNVAGNVASGLANGISGAMQAAVATRRQEAATQQQAQVNARFLASLDDPALLKMIGPGRVQALKALARTDPGAAQKALSTLTSNAPTKLAPGDTMNDMSGAQTAQGNPDVKMLAPGDTPTVNGKAVGPAAPFKPEPVYNANEHMGDKLIDAWKLSPYADVSPDVWQQDPTMKAAINKIMLQTIAKGVAQPEQTTLAKSLIEKGVDNLAVAKTQIDQDAEQFGTIQDAMALLKQGVNVGPKGNLIQNLQTPLIAAGIIDPNSDAGTRYARTQEWYATAMKNIASVIHSMKISRITERELAIFENPAGANPKMLQDALSNVYTKTLGELQDRTNNYRQNVDNVTTDPNTGVVDQNTRNLWQVKPLGSPSTGSSIDAAHPPKTYNVGGQSVIGHWDNDTKQYWIQSGGKFVPAPKDR